MPGWMTVLYPATSRFIRGANSGSSLGDLTARRGKKSKPEFSESVPLVSRETESPPAAFVNAVPIRREHNMPIDLVVFLSRSSSAVVAGERANRGAFGFRCTARLEPAGRWG